ncbi:CPBP family intramembrane metalloprotease [Endozoicomonas gorgoniicola]|uniref:CPBP family intramembrane metalloprotease n=1 Tax=Endozoicomonas gorgoniicola TaxID=1234144 RepID=A0ABT3MVT2_9GAMM|nr:CPBP family intramembrane glutamic endopeptidase [Endozoicomonas gorgoniicola]MCW7553492.1 CPBP family intramembrane metalloprotease [Endozoicomonas gorgoniicola]
MKTTHLKQGRTLFYPVIACTIFEELLCRSIVHNLANKMTNYIFQQKDNAKFTASCLSSGFFGLIHLTEPDAFVKASFATVNGFAFARTYNDYGLLGSISSHMTYNLVLNTVVYTFGD